MATAARAANEGQADLDAAIEANLDADSLDDLAKVVKLCESALEKGLDETNTDFAKKLYGGALVQRASVLSGAIINPRTGPNPKWKTLRRDALADLEKALTLDPAQPQVQFLIGKLQGLPEGDAAKARKAFDAAIELSKEEPKLRSKAFVGRAQLTDDKDKRLADLNEAIKLTPDDAEAVRLRGIALLYGGKPEEAIRDFDAGVKLTPDSADAHLARGVTLYLLKRYDDAIAALDKTLALQAKSATALMHRARAYTAKSDWKKAIEDYDAAIKLAGEENSTLLLLLRAEVHQKAGDEAAAKTDVESAMKNRSQTSIALQMRALLFAGKAEMKLAVGDLTELRKVAPKNVELMIQIAILQTLTKNHEKAVEAYTAIIAEKPDFWQAYRGRGDSYLSLGKHAEAVADLDAALKLNPKDPNILNNLAWVLATSPDDKVRDGKRAVELAKQACELTDYEQAHILSTLASAYAESGDFDTAIKWSKKAVEIGGDIAAQLKKELESYEKKQPWREAKTPEEDLLEDAPSTSAAAPAPDAE